MEGQSLLTPVGVETLLQRLSGEKCCSAGPNGAGLRVGTGEEAPGCINKLGRGHARACIQLASLSELRTTARMSPLRPLWLPSLTARKVSAEALLSLSRRGRTSPARSLSSKRARAARDLV